MPNRKRSARKRLQKEYRPEATEYDENWRRRMHLDTREKNLRMGERYARAVQQANVIAVQLWKPRPVPVITQHGIRLERSCFVQDATGKIGVIAQVTAPHINKTVYAYYPGRTEARVYAKGIPHTRWGGSNELCPGSVGILESYILAPGSGHDVELVIDLLQGSTIKKVTPGLTNGLQSKHFHWRKHLLEQVFFMAQKNGIKRIQIILSTKGGKQNRELFSACAQEHGHAIEELPHGRGLLARLT